MRGPGKKENPEIGKQDTYKSQYPHRKKEVEKGIFSLAS
jgi:hypothetical protein